MAPSPIRQMRSLLCGRAFAAVGGGGGVAAADMMEITLAWLFLLAAMISFPRASYLQQQI